MKVFLYYFFALSFVLFSCTETTIEESLISQQNGNSMDNDSELRSYPGDGKYDVLGWGCDVVENMYAEKLPVINNDYIIAAFGPGEYDGGVAPGKKNMGDYGLEAGSDAVTFLKSHMQNLKVVVDVKAYGVSAKSTLSSFAKDSSAYDSKYSYASYEVYIQKGGYRYVPRVEELRNYVTDAFKKEIDNHFDPQSIIARYGTHVYSDVKIGGKLRVTYRAEITGTFSQSESKKSIAASIGVNNVAAAVVGTSVNVSTDLSEEEKSMIKRDSKNAQYVLNVIGGSVNVPIVDMVMDVTNTPTMNTAKWIESVKGTDTELIGFDSGSLIPIWEFVEDPVKKEQLMLAVVRYFAEHDFKLAETPLPLICLHQYWADKASSHFYTTSSNFVYDDFRYEYPIGYILDKQLPGSVPLYYFWSEKNWDHFYATQIVHHEDYSLHGTVGYVYDTPKPNTIPLHQYWSDRFRDHYYSTANVGNSNPDYRYEGIAMYIYPLGVK